MRRGSFYSRLGIFASDERGVTAVEYGLMLAIFSLVVTTALSTLGTHLVGMFERVVELMN
ncbi:MAG TPA: Flp family type IVb pilin [Parvibaculum sp.]|uniref:Flp family type IVb pilin n=1 Tax=Parvibaculum sp. TaxID=2024848 RepID=UPI002C234E6F|nr:Flp family type IVb pilin [Parvibaculum sp.]HMM15564.1 Flp family type IVb pilin [Parvibaculum sp.]